MTATGPWPVSGRDQPRPPAQPAAHELRLWRLTDEEARDAGKGLRLECEPCSTARLIEDGHQVEDLAGLAVQHEGSES